MMDESIKSIMQRHTAHWKLDKKLFKQLDDFVKQFINLNEDHVNFFGGNLTGVNIVKFTTRERFQLTEDILEIDDLAIQREVKQLAHIGDTWVRGTDGLNLALLYLVHVIETSKTLSHKDKQFGQVAALLILQYKFLSSTMTAYFKYPVSEPVALAAYQSLSGKYAIKKYGTWQELLKARCYAIIQKEQTHLNTVKTFQPDDSIQYMITDIQGRLKQMILNIYSVTITVKENNQALASSSSTIELDGELVLKDLTNLQTDYLHYLRDVAGNPRDLIKEDLVEVIDNSITTLPKKVLVDSLLVFSKQSGAKNSTANQLMEEIIFYSFGYFNANKHVVKNIHDYSLVMKTMKDLYTAGKSSNPSVLKTRKLADSITKKVLKTSNPQTIAAARIGLILYILLRALTKNHYS